MTKRDKILEQMRNNPRDWRIDILLQLAAAHGLEARNDGGSHHVFSFPGIPEGLCVPAHRPIKPIYIKRFIALLDAVQELNDGR
jgi:hypothetical protein